MICEYWISMLSALMLVQVYSTMAEQPKTFKGLFQGSCHGDGLYYNNEHSFVMCTGKNYYIQPCPPGTMNRPFRGDNNFNDEFQFENFCDINLNNFGISNINGDYADKLGYRDMKIPHDNKENNKNIYERPHEYISDTYNNDKKQEYGFPSNEDGYQTTGVRYQPHSQRYQPGENDRYSPQEIDRYSPKPSSRYEPGVYPQVGDRHHTPYDTLQSHYKNPPKQQKYDSPKNRHNNDKIRYGGDSDIRSHPTFSEYDLAPAPKPGMFDKGTHYEHTDPGRSYQNQQSDENTTEYGKKDGASNFLYMVISMPKSMVKKMKGSKGQQYEYAEKDPYDKNASKYLDGKILASYHRVKDPSHGPYPKREPHGYPRPVADMQTSSDKAYYNSKDHRASHYPPPVPPY